MCVRTLLDASAFRHVLEKSPNTAGHQLRKWITRRHGVVVYSDHWSYAAELDRYQEIRDLLVDYRQRGMARRVAPERVEAERNRIPARRRSNDPHVLAVAAAGEATVLVSCDGALRHDFCELLPNVGRRRRRSFPLEDERPQDTDNANRRRKFLETRKCPFRLDVGRRARKARGVR